MRFLKTIDKHSKNLYTVNRSASINTLYLIVQFPSLSNMATINDVAKRAGVSVSTVSYTLSGKRSVSEKTRQRILAVIEEMDYHPHALARGLASHHSRTIGIMYPSETHGLSEGQLELVLNAATVATQYGYSVMLWASPLKPEEVWQLAQRNLLEGIILTEIKWLDGRVDLLRSMNYPFVMIGRCEDTHGLCFVDLDFADALLQSVNYLADLGHRRIVLINASPDLLKAGFTAALMSQDGFHKGIADRGLHGEVYSCKPTPKHAYELMQSLFSRYPDLTAVITIIERVVPGILEAVYNTSRCIPRDFSLVGVMSHQIAERINPPVTSINTSANVGQLAIEALVRRLENEAAPPTQILLKPALVVRQTSGPCCSEAQVQRGG